MGAERMGRVGARRAAGWVIVDALVLLYALVPVLWILSLSLKPTSTVKDGKLIPSSQTFDNYRGIFRGNYFSSALVNSVGIGVTHHGDRGGDRRDGGVCGGATGVSRQARC